MVSNVRAKGQAGRKKTRQTRVILSHSVWRFYDSCGGQSCRVDYMEMVSSFFTLAATFLR